MGDEKMSDWYVYLKNGAMLIMYTREGDLYTDEIFESLKNNSENNISFENGLIAKSEIAALLWVKQ